MQRGETAGNRRSEQAQRRKCNTSDPQFVTRNTVGATQKKGVVIDE